VADNELDIKALVTQAQRAADGYFNATAMCKKAGKEWKHYWSNATTRAFIGSLSSEVGIPTSELIQQVRGGTPELQGTWVHPLVATHLAQWISPDFAVAVSIRVTAWMQDRTQPSLPDPKPEGQLLIAGDLSVNESWEAIIALAGHAKRKTIEEHRAQDLRLTKKEAQIQVLTDERRKIYGAMRSIGSATDKRLLDIETCESSDAIPQLLAPKPKRKKEDIQEAVSEADIPASEEQIARERGTPLSDHPTFFVYATRKLLNDNFDIYTVEETAALGDDAVLNSRILTQAREAAMRLLASLRPN
jgi:hypothetical protein